MLALIFRVKKQKLFGEQVLFNNSAYIAIIGKTCINKTVLILGDCFVTLGNILISFLVGVASVAKIITDRMQWSKTLTLYCESLQ